MEIVDDALAALFLKNIKLVWAVKCNSSVCASILHQNSAVDLSAALVLPSKWCASLITECGGKEREGNVRDGIIPSYVVRVRRGKREKGRGKREEGKKREGGREKREERREKREERREKREVS